MAHVKRMNYKEVHVFMYLIKYAHMAHIKRINYRGNIPVINIRSNKKDIEERPFYPN